MIITQPECICSFRYPACNAHGPYCHLWPATLYNIFPQFLINGTILQKNATKHKMGVLFSVQLVSETFIIVRRYDKKCTRVGTLIVATIYLQLIQNRYMFRSFTVLHCSHQHCVQPVASDVEVVGYL